MSGLWRNNPATPGGKYLVTRRDGTIPDWPYIVLGALDPAAAFALRQYAEKAKELGYDPEYVSDIRKLANQYDEYRATHGDGNPTAPPERTDNPDIVAKMLPGRSA